MALDNKPYIILTGSDGGYGNLGDEWLSAATKAHYDNIKKHFNVIFLMANVPDKLSDGFEYIADNLTAFKKRSISIKDIAAVHYYGGGYINSYWMKEKLWLYDFLTDAGFPKNRFFFTGLGLGPLTNKEITDLKVISNNAAYFGTRDNCFADKVKSEFMFDESVFVVPPIRRSLRRKRELWINFRIASHVGADETKISTLLDQLNRFATIYHLDIKYFAMIKGDGFNEKSEMERVLKANNINNPVIERVNDYSELLNQFKNAAMVITTSYHATLASIYKDIPVVAVYENEYYKFKYQGLKDVIDTPLLNMINLANYEVDVLQMARKSKDRYISTKINNLKQINAKAYRQYEEFLGICE